MNRQAVPKLNIADFEISREDIFNPSSTGSRRWNFSGGCPESLDIVKRLSRHPSFPNDLGTRINRACSLSYPLHSDTAAAQRSLLFSQDRLESIDEDATMNDELNRAAAEMEKQAEVVGNLRGFNPDEDDLDSMSTIGDNNEKDDEVFDSINWANYREGVYAPGVRTSSSVLAGGSSASKAIGGQYTGQIGFSLALQEYWSGKRSLSSIPEKFNGYKIVDLVDHVQTGLDKYIKWLMEAGDADFNPYEYEQVFFTARTLVYLLNRLHDEKNKALTEQELDAEIREDITNELKDISALIDELLVSQIKFGKYMMSDYVWATIRMSAHAYNHGRCHSSAPKVSEQQTKTNYQLMHEINKVLVAVDTMDKNLTPSVKEKEDKNKLFNDMMFDKCSAIEEVGKKTTESLNALTAQVTNLAKMVGNANFVEKAPVLKGDYKLGKPSGTIPKTSRIVEETPALDDREEYESWFKIFITKYYSVQQEFDLTPRDYATLEYICKKHGYAATAHNTMILCLLNGEKPQLALSATLKRFLNEAKLIPTEERFKWGLDILGDIESAPIRRSAGRKPAVRITKTASGTQITDSIWE